MRVAAIALVFLAMLQAPQKFRSGVEVVRVDVLVTDRHSPVPGLKAADFEMRDNGRVQHIESVVFGDVPLSVSLVLDISESVEGERLSHLKDAAAAALKALKREDRAAVLTFSHQLTLESAFTPDRSVLIGRTANLSSGGGTSLYDAALTAMILRDAGATRALVLIFSDGQDTSSWLPAEAVLNAARRNDAVVYAVALKDIQPSAPFRLDMSAQLPLGFAPDDGEQNFLTALARETGGQVFYADNVGEVRQRFIQAIEEFKTRYVLTYYPTGVDTRGWHAIEVKVKGKRYTLSARRGYQR